MPASARERFLASLRSALEDGSFLKLTLGKPRSSDPSLRNVFVRPVMLKRGPHLAFVWRHQTRDVTKNILPADALPQIEAWLGTDFLDAHLFTTGQTVQLELQSRDEGRLRFIASGSSATAAPAASLRHDTPKQYLISGDSAWLRSLGVTNDRGQPREGMADKFRQIQKFAELVHHLVEEAFGPPAQASEGREPLHVADMGSGKGYLTFAVATVLAGRARTLGIEARLELVELCNRVCREHGLEDRLSFTAGTIATAPVAACDVLIALHACDTATDDALARGIAAGARLLIVSPCCQKELRSQLQAPAVLRDALRHGIFQERQAEFVTDALRAHLLEWAGYSTRVFEFISTEHTAKNLMIAAVKTRPGRESDDPRLRTLRDFAGFYGIQTQALARHLGVELGSKRT